MSYSVRKVDNSYRIWDNTTCIFVNPACYAFSTDEIEKYIENNPFPEDPCYSSSDLIFDLTNSDGALIILCRWESTAWYVAELISYLIIGE